MVQTEEIRRFEKNQEKSGKIRKNKEKIWNPDEIPERKMIISHLTSKRLNL